VSFALLEGRWCGHHYGRCTARAVGAAPIATRSVSDGPRCTTRAVGAGNPTACEGAVPAAVLAPCSARAWMAAWVQPLLRRRSTPAPRGAGGRWGLPDFPWIVGLILHSEAVQPCRTGNTSAPCSRRPMRRSAARRLRSGWWGGGAPAAVRTRERPRSFAPAMAAGPTAVRTQERPRSFTPAMAAGPTAVRTQERPRSFTPGNTADPTLQAEGPGRSG